MQRVKRTTAVAVLPAAPAGGTPGYFAAPNPQGGVPATVPGYEWYNGVQEEIVALIAAAGLTLDAANNAQMLEAVQRLIDAQSGNYALDTGVANAYVVALNPAITAYGDGLTVRVKIVNANTAASTLNAGGGVVPLVNDVGGALVAGDLAAGGIVTATYIASAGKFYITSLVPSQAMSQAQADARYTPIAYTKRFVDITANITLSAADSGGFANISGGAVAALPSPPADGQRYILIGVGAGGSVAAPAGSSLVLPDGTSTAAGSLTIGAGTSVEVIARGDNNTWTVYNTSGQVVTKAAVAGNHAVNLGQFASSLAASGYVKTPDATSPTGTRIEQWGTFSLAAAASSAQAITFPIAFPTALTSVDISVDTAATDMIGTSARSLTGMTISKGGNDITARTGFWRSYGY